MTNCQCLSPTVSLAFYSLALKHNKSMKSVRVQEQHGSWLRCDPLIKRWYVSLSHSCKQFGEDEDDAEGSRATCEGGCG